MIKFLRQIKPIYLLVAGAIVALVVIFIIIALVRGFGGNKTVNKNIPRFSTQPTVSFSVGGKGDARVSGIVINGNSSGTITATSTINKKPISFIIKTNKSTLVRKGNATSSVSRLVNSDIITVTGVIENFGDTITLTAKDIRALGTYGPSQIKK